MKNKKVLITAPYLQLVIEKYQSIFDSRSIKTILPKVSERMSEEELLSYIGDVDGIICGDDKITEQVLSSAPLLKVIVKWGTGTDSIDKEAAAKRGIPVRNTPNAFTNPVADTTIGFILCFARGIIDLNEKIKKGIWEKKNTRALNECTLGVIGLGNIGTAVVKRAEAFGMRILATDIKEKPHDYMVPLEILLHEADFITLHTDLNPKSHHLLNNKRFRLMKPTAYVINTSRGPVIREEDLIEALKNKIIAGAALDVFENEPLPNDSPLKTMSNVILSPHNSNAGRAAWEKVHENSINSLIEELCRHE